MNKEKLLNYLLNYFNLDLKQIKEHQDYYNSNFDEYDNDIYNDIKKRFVHLLNFWETDNWFNDRLKIFFKYFQDFEGIIDIGFGLPYLALYLEEKNILSKWPKMILVDKFKSSIQVSEQILKFMSLDATLIKLDVEEVDIFRKIVATKKTDNNLVVAIEVIEHLENPEAFWSLAKKLNSTAIIVSLPIGPTIPSHHMSFPTVASAREYLNKYINIIDEEILEAKGKENRNIDDYSCLTVFGKLK